MAKRSGKRDENSVNVALESLMSLEDQRQLEEEREIQRQEEAERRASEEAEERQRAAEEASRRREEEERLAAEQQRADDVERRRLEEREREIRIQAEAEARARIDEQERLLIHQLELKRLERQGRGAPAWSLAVLAAMILVLAGGGVLFHLDSKEEATRRLRSVQAEHEDRLRRTEARLEDARLAAESAELKLAREAKENARLQQQIATLSAAETEPAPRRQGPARPPRRGDGKAGPKPDRDDGALPSLTGDPLQDFSLDGKREKDRDRL